MTQPYAPHFQIVRQRDGRFHWELINPHATTAARSMETFATEDEAAANAEYAQRLISRGTNRAFSMTTRV